MSNPDVCPTCGEQLVPVVYGYPGPELFDAADRREVVLGGCVVGDSDPQYACPWQGDGHA